MTSPYIAPEYARGSAHMAAASINNTVVTSSQIQKTGGGSITINPMNSTTNSPTHYSPTNTYTNLTAVSTNAGIQSRGDNLKGGIKRKKSKRRKSKRRKSKKNK
jgi:hypothetical protein